jgi:hypothetical protein
MKCTNKPRWIKKLINTKEGTIEFYESLIKMHEYNISQYRLFIDAMIALDIDTTDLYNNIKDSEALILDYKRKILILEGGVLKSFKDLLN